MKCLMARVLTLVLVWGLGASIAAAQNTAQNTGQSSTQNSTSSVPLGDLARQLKAQRAKSQGKAKVVTNDDLAAPAPSLTNPSTNAQEANPGEEAAQNTDESEVGKEPTKTPGAEKGEQPHDEKYYREHMSKLRDRLQIDQRQLDVLQQKLGQNEMQYYPDPSKGLLQESGPTALSDVHKLQDQIAKKKAEVEADQKAIDDLEDQLRRDGGDPGWLR